MADVFCPLSELSQPLSLSDSGRLVELLAKILAQLERIESKRREGGNEEQIVCVAKSFPIGPEFEFESATRHVSTG